MIGINIGLNFTTGLLLVTLLVLLVVLSTKITPAKETLQTRQVFPNNIGPICKRKI